MSTVRTKRAPTVVMSPDLEVRELPFKIGSGRTLASQKTVSRFDTTKSPAGHHANDAGEDRIRLRFFYRPSDGHLVGKVWFGEGAEGPPGHVHGGASAYVLDEAMGSVGWMNHLPILAAHLDFDYRKPTPLFHDLTIEAWLGESSGRRINIQSRLLLDDVVCVEGHGEFAIIPRSKISHLADENDPQVLAIINDSQVRWAAE